VELSKTQICEMFCSCSVFYLVFRNCFKTTRLVKR